MVERGNPHGNPFAGPIPLHQGRAAVCGITLRRRGGGGLCRTHLWSSQKIICGLTSDPVACRSRKTPGDANHRFGFSCPTRRRDAARERFWGETPVLEAGLSSSIRLRFAFRRNQRAVCFVPQAARRPVPLRRRPLHSATPRARSERAFSMTRCASASVWCQPRRFARGSCRPRIPPRFAPDRSAE